MSLDLHRAMETYVAVVDEEGFAAAARRLRVSPPAVTRTIQLLEAHLSAQLLLRSTRRVVPTDRGWLFYHRARQALEAAAAAVNAVAPGEEKLSGRIKVNAPMSFGIHYLAPLVCSFMNLNPEVQVELVLNDRMVDPMEEGFDLSIRIAEPFSATSLVSRTLAPANRVVCASPAYLADRGTPLLPADLTEHRCLHYGYQVAGQRWQLAGPEGIEHVAVNCVLWSNNGDVLRTAALAGQGITLLPTFIVGGELQNGTLIRLLPDYQVPGLEIQAVYARHPYLERRVLGLIDLLADRLSGRPGWDLVD